MGAVILSELIDGLEAEIRGIDLNAAITFVSYDSRNIPSDGVPIFFAIKGAHVDANSFIKEVISKNPRAVVISEDGGLVRGVVVGDLSLSMAVIARKFFHKPDESLKTVAITGTNGKTTIGFLTRALLSTRSKTGLLGTIEYDLGDGQALEAVNTTPLALRFFHFLDVCKKNGCQNVVFEASSHAIEQKRIYNLSLDVAIFTNLSQEHLDYHKTLERYFSAKVKLFDGQNGSFPRFSLVNIDDTYGKRLFEHLKSGKQTVFGFGESSGADFQIVNIAENVVEGTRFGIKHEGKIENFATHLVGRHNISNVTASICAAFCLGINADEIRGALKNFLGVPGRLERVLLKNGAIAFVDYAHTPAALETVLGVLRAHADKRLITVFGCGGDRDRTKRAPMTKVVCSFSDRAIATADNSRTEPLEQIFSDMRVGVPSGANIKFIPDRRAAIMSALRASGPGDIVLIAGRGHENDQKIGDKLVHFNDKEVVEEFNA